jgi:GDP-L-fucose synthase
MHDVSHIGPDELAKSFVPQMLNRDATFYVAGHRGLVGSAIWRLLEKEGFTNLIGQSHADLDLQNRDKVFAFFEENKPKYVVLAAAKVGGIYANDTYPVEFLSENLQMQLNVIDAAHANGVERLLFLGSSCIYPKLAPQPLKEDYLLTGQLEHTNYAYAIAKIAGILHIQAMRQEYGHHWISAMPTNLYGPGDNFHPQHSHVLPALIRRYDDAELSGALTVTNWGSGNPRREFIHVDDMADACLFMLENYDGSSQVNVGTGVDCTIKEIAQMIAASTGFQGETEWDTSKPDGTPQKLLDVSLLEKAGWKSKISLQDGISQTVSWYRENKDSLRG